jgi:hypothetical protein
MAPRILNIGIDGGEWSVTRSGRFTAGARVSSTYWTGGWVGPQGLCNEEKNSCPCRESNPGLQFVT